eukprot:TRINITY_DN2837_c0_g2_i6.p1 TRINITY_DN2837_c0_g2~~TRINITY_DN2837_c0_g2_i6.p1  ORF type:complete len:204 (+),score=55.28 TRINITY_DN2837_c0_g2_i6:87-698(+)
MFIFFFFFFKQKTAYEMLRSLVGSEMCIRDRCSTSRSARSKRSSRGLRLPNSNSESAWVYTKTRALNPEHTDPLTQHMHPALCSNYVHGNVSMADSRRSLSSRGGRFSRASGAPTHVRGDFDKLQPTQKHQYAERAMERELRRALRATRIPQHGVVVKQDLVEKHFKLLIDTYGMPAEARQQKWTTPANANTRVINGLYNKLR